MVDAKLLAASYVGAELKSAKGKSIAGSYVEPSAGVSVQFCGTPLITLIQKQTCRRYSIFDLNELTKEEAP